MRKLAHPPWGLTLILGAAGACGVGSSTDAGGGGGTLEQAVEDADARPPSDVPQPRAGADGTYRVEEDAGSLVAHNVVQQLQIRFDRSGVRLSPLNGHVDEPSWSATIAIGGYGCSEQLENFDASDPIASDNRVDQAHGPIAAWYLNGPLGLEQGFDLQSPPSCYPDSGTVTVRLHVEGLRPQRVSDDHVVLVSETGARPLRYHGLYVTDAEGDAVRAALRVSRGDILIDVDAAGAVFPLVIDPLWSKQAVLISSDIAWNDYFGAPVDISGDTVIVGAQRDDDKGSDSGSAYVFVRTGATWSQQAKLTASDGNADDWFGSAVAISGDVAVVGAHNREGATVWDHDGAAYVFRRNGSVWSEEEKLTTADDETFGNSLHLEGDTLLVGAVGATGGGAAYVYQRSGSSWLQQAKLVGSDTVSGDLLGQDVAVSGDTALVGSRFNGELGQYAGAVYVFVRNATIWTEQAKLLGSDTGPNDQFGRHVSIDGDTAAIGTDQKRIAGSAYGAAYVFVRTGTNWTEQARLYPSDGFAASNYGRAIDIVQDEVAVGAHAGTYLGAVYVYQRSGSTWTEQQILDAGQSGTSGFGMSLGMVTDTMVVGSPSTAAYVFVRVGGGCSVDGDCASNYCRDGVCCKSDCGGGDPSDCQACSQAAGAEVDGICGISSGNDCDDGLFCNGSESCTAGVCGDSSGDPCAGPDGDADCAETCDEIADSCAGADPDGSPCPDDGAFCNGIESCQGGGCVSAGSPCPGPDGDGDCAESCDEIADGCDASDTDGALCDDGLFCTASDSCSAGTCQGSNDPCAANLGDADTDCSESCDESADSCSAPDPNGSSCLDDDQFCNGVESCEGGICIHQGYPCPGPDGDADCSEMCDEVFDNCNAPDANGAGCDDGLFCNGVDTCNLGLCTNHAGAVCGGVDGDDDCSETCDEVLDSCDGPDPDGSACTDGLFCTFNDLCQGGACVSGPDPCPGSDGDGDCAESCNEATDECTASDVDGSNCSDGDDCTQTDSCQSGVCQGDDPVTCQALDSCHGVGSCNPQDGLCDNPVVPNGTSCPGGICQDGSCLGSGGAGGASSGGAGGASSSGAGGASSSSSGDGGSAAAGGASSSNGDGGDVAAGGEGGAGEEAPMSVSDSGCGCRTAGGPPGRSGWALLLASPLLFCGRRRRPHRPHTQRRAFPCPSGS